MMSYILPPKTTDDLPKNENSSQNGSHTLRNAIIMVAVIVVALVVLYGAFTMIDLYSDGVTRERDYQDARKAGKLIKSGLEYLKNDE